MRKPLVFISHITEERELAQALKALIEATFLDMVEVFVSSDPTSIKLGRKWLDEITQALKQCKIEIILASPASIRRPWINFEAGSGWIRDLPVIPLCHSDIVPSKLPAPLVSLQGGVATDEASLKLLFSVVAEAVGCRLPAVDFSPFIATVTAFEATSRQIEKLRDETPIPPTDGLAPHELAAFLELAELTYTPGGMVGIHLLREAMKEAGFRQIATILALTTLSRKDFVELGTDADINEEYPAARITDEGWAWIGRNQDKISLVSEKAKPTRPFDESQEFKEDDIPF